MLAVLGECLQAVQSELSFIPLANAFELFGMDLARAPAAPHLCSCLVPLHLPSQLLLPCPSLRRRRGAWRYAVLLMLYRRSVLSGIAFQMLCKWR